MKKSIILFLLCIFACYASAATPVFNDGAGDHLWRNADNWASGLISSDTSGDLTKIRAAQCILDEDTTGGYYNMYVGETGFPVPTLTMTGGTLSSVIATGTSGMSLANSSDATFNMSGGTFNQPYGTVRMGRTSGVTAYLNVSGGTFITGKLTVGATTGAVARIVISGNGKLKVVQELNGIAFLGNNPDYASMDIKGDGMFIWTGDHVSAMNSYINTIKTIFTSEPDGELETRYFETANVTVVALKGVIAFLDGDINQDFYVNTDDLGVIVDQWLSSEITAPNNPNPLIFAPEIDEIIVDGDLSDWQESSDWAVFGKWWPGGLGLTSTTKAQYAWNTDANMLYIGIKSTEGLGLKLEIGGLLGDLTDLSVTPSGSNAAGQIRFYYENSDITIESQISTSIVGVDAAYTWDGTTMTIEIEMPIYSDWVAGTGKLDLTSGMDIYEYANVFDGSEPVTGGDSQNADGVQIYFLSAPVVEVGAAIRLLDSLPGTCSDRPSTRKNMADLLGTDCLVNLTDFAVLAGDWLECTYPLDDECD
jgi:hypothetical protein